MGTSSRSMKFDGNFAQEVYKHMSVKSAARSSSEI